jgi:hypothetical protein
MKKERRTSSHRGAAIPVAALLLIAGVSGCSKGARITTATADPAALNRFHTFAVTAPTPRADRIAVGVSDSDRAGGAVMDMDPMLATSLVGRAMHQDLVTAFSGRGYHLADGNADFQVAYYAGTGRVIDTRAYDTPYHADGHKIDTRTFEYPAGTIIVDVVDARSDSLVWRGTGIAEVPDDPDDYAKAIRGTINDVVAQFPKAPKEKKEG